MSRVRKLRNKHWCCSVFKAQTQPNDTAGDCEHGNTLSKRLQEHSDDDNLRKCVSWCIRSARAYGGVAGKTSLSRDNVLRDMGTICAVICGVG